MRNTILEVISRHKHSMRLHNGFNFSLMIFVDPDPPTKRSTHNRPRVSKASQIQLQTLASVGRRTFKDRTARRNPDATQVFRLRNGVTIPNQNGTVLRSRFQTGKGIRFWEANRNANDISPDIVAGGGPCASQLLASGIAKHMTHV